MNEINQNTAAISVIRTFLTIVLNEAIQKQLTEVSGFLQQYYQNEKITWSKFENLHITLRFLGATETSHLPQLIAEINKALHGLTAFELTFSQLEFFPARHPHIVALMVNYSPRLAQLVAAIEQAVITCGFTPETQPWQPHLTLARFSGSLPPLPVLTGLPKKMLVSEVALVHSHLTTFGSVYRKLEKFSLPK